MMNHRAVAIITPSQDPYGGHSATQTDQCSWPSMGRRQWGQGWLSWLSLTVEPGGVFGGLVGLWGQGVGQDTSQPTCCGSFLSQNAEFAQRHVYSQENYYYNQQYLLIAELHMNLGVHNAAYFELINTALSPQPRETIVNRGELWHSWKASQPSGNVQINVCEPSSA